MKKILFPAALISILASSGATAFAYETTANHALIMDNETGIVLFEKDAENPMVPASMTKIMTAYMVFERLSDGRLSEDDTFTVSERAWREGGWASGGSTMGLAIGSEVSVIDLLRGMIVQSGNDACIVLAEGISGSEEAFAAEMTARAQELGLSTASFKNATGLLAEDHEISAYDLARLADLVIQQFPEYYALYNVRDFTWSGIRQPNRNPLLSRFQGADGLKTGHLEASGYGLVGSAIVDGERRTIVINGLESESARAQEAERMMRSAFREFSVATPYAAGDALGSVPVWLGSAETVGLVVDQDVQIGFENASRRDLKAEIVLPASISAPVTAGDVVGSLIISNGDVVLAEYPVSAAESVSKKGLIARAFEGLATLIAPSSSPASAEG